MRTSLAGEGDDTPATHDRQFRDRIGRVLSWASIIDANALGQALQIACGHVTSGHVAVMPDAHFGLGACVGTAIVTDGGIYPAAVGVDIGCGMVAARLNLGAATVDLEQRRRLRNELGGAIPSGVGRNHEAPTAYWHAFEEEFGLAPSLEDGWLVSERGDLRQVAAEQFGTLGAGNHFVEFSVDAEGALWAIVHSGSRGIGNTIARAHIAAAQRACASLGDDLEHRDLAFLEVGTEAFERYVGDMLWAQQYAWHQRAAMLQAALETLRAEGLSAAVTESVHCHHNYSERRGDGRWLSRKGAVNASAGQMAVLPGSMGTDSYIVRGLGNAESYETAPHGAGRVSARGRRASATRAATGAYARFTVDEFKERMEARGVVWQDRDALNQLDESPMVYKPIEVVLADSADLIEPVYRLQQIVNYKGV